MELLAQFSGWFGRVFDLPAILLVAIMVVFGYVLRQIQKDKANRFEFADIFLDESGKASAARMMVLISGGVSSWGLMYMLMHDTEGKIEPIFYISYMAVWSGSAIAVKALEIWAGRGGRSDDSNKPNS